MTNKVNQIEINKTILEVLKLIDHDSDTMDALLRDLNKQIIRDVDMENKGCGYEK